MSLPHVRSYTKWGIPPISLERADSVVNFDLTVSGVMQLPDYECYELFIQADNDVYIGNSGLQNILLPAGATAILDVSNSNLIWISGNTNLHIMILR